MKNTLSHIEKQGEKHFSTVGQILDLIIPRLVLNKLLSTLDIHLHDIAI